MLCFKMQNCHKSFVEEVVSCSGEIVDIFIKGI